VKNYSSQSSLLRGLDVFALFAVMMVVIQTAYAASSGGYPFESMISALCGSLGFLVLILSLRFHLTPSVKSEISHERSFVDFLLGLSLLFLFVWNFMN